MNEIETIAEVLQDAKFYVDGITEPGDNGTFQLTHGAAKWFAESLVAARQPQPVTEGIALQATFDTLREVREQAQQRIQELKATLVIAERALDVAFDYFEGAPIEEEAAEATIMEARQDLQALRPKDAG